MLHPTMKKINFLLWHQPSLYFLMKSILNKSVVHQQQAGSINAIFHFQETKKWQSGCGKWYLRHEKSATNQRLSMRRKEYSFLV